MKKVHSLKLLLLCILIGTLGRLIPHLPNVTPLTNLSLLAGSQLKRFQALSCTFFSLFISDLFLGYFYHYALFGYWSLFTYSGFFAITLLGKYLSLDPKKLRTLSFVLISSVGFWLWTNLGVWLAGNFYPQTFDGLRLCYIAALPFLRNAMIGDFIWMVVVFDLLFRRLQFPKKLLVLDS